MRVLEKPTRLSAKHARVSAWQARVSTKWVRVSAWPARVSTKWARVSAWHAGVSAWPAGVSAWQARVSAWQARVSAWLVRVLPTIAGVLATRGPPRRGIGRSSKNRSMNGNPRGHFRNEGNGRLGAPAGTHRPHFENERRNVMSTSKSSRTSRARQMIVGIAKHFTNGSQSISVNGASLTVTALTQVLQDFVDQRQAVETARANLKAKVEIDRTRSPSQLAVIRAFDSVARGTFGNSPDVLADFGLEPRKARTSMTTEAKAVAAAKRNATRAARHTMGKNQKRDVKGAIKASLVVTPLDGSAPVTPASNAPSGNTPPVAAAAAPTGNAPAAPAAGTAPAGSTVTHS
jgi:hypothetical protein